MKKILMFLFLSVMAYGRLEVATTIFPVYDGVKIIGGDRVEVSLLVRPGIEPHSFEPSPRDMVRLNKSDVFLYLDDSMETWIHRFEKNIDVDTVGVAKGIEFREDEEGKSHNHNHSYDPHIWLDPILYIEIVKNISEELTKRDPDGSDYYRKNYENYRERLMDLHKKTEEVVSVSRYKKIIYAGHFSFGYFIRRYDLEYISVYKNYSPNANISPKDLKNIIEEVKRSGQKYIYQEALVNSKTAELISRETGTEVLMLHQLGGISKDEMSKNYGYIDLMEKNINELRKGLGYEKDN